MSPVPTHIERRNAFWTHLLVHGPSPGSQSPPDPPSDAASIVYRSGNAELPAYIVRPRDARSRCPGLLYSHGGCSISGQDFAAAALFAEAGFIVLLPTYRGEHGNAGDYELFFGEVDDARAAAVALAALPNIDPQSVYAFGYSMGGEIAALLSLFGDLPLRATGSCGPFFLRSDPFSSASMYGAPVPFDRTDREEVELRLLRTHLRALAVPHAAFVGREDEKFSDGAWREVDVEGTCLTITEVEGTHDTSLLPAVRAFLARIVGS